MILFYGEGRFGNQIFQYQALSHIARPGERILAAGLEELQGNLDLHGPALQVLTRKRWVKLIVKYIVIPVLLRPAARVLRLVNYVIEPSEQTATTSEPSGLILQKSGLFGRVTFVDGGHYQNSSLWTSVFPSAVFEVKESLRGRARRFLDSSGTDDCRRSFVHVRRGDYLVFSQHGLSSVALPKSYYINAIRELERRTGRAHLVFVTDDPQWVEDTFPEISDKSVAAFDVATDFAIMTECVDGIASNSTFSLAAAYMLKNPCLVIVPKYWFGFGKNVWSPPRIFSAHPKLLAVAVEG